MMILSPKISQTSHFISSKHICESIVEHDLVLDEGTFEQIWRVHYKELLIFAGNLLRNNIMVDDIVSDAFIKLWILRDNFRNRRSVKPFLYKVVKNYCIDILRQQKTKRKVFERLFYSGEEMDNSLFDGYEPDQLKILTKQTSQLPSACRAIFECYFFKGQNTKEIAVMFNLSEQTVRNQWSKALKILRATKLKKE